MPPPRPVLVIGGGVCGLTAGVRLLEAGFAVRIVAREPAAETVSAVAAALWYPYHAGPPARVARWAARSHAVFSALAREESTGVLLRDGVEVGVAAGELTWAREAGMRVRPARPDELPPGETLGAAWRLPVVDMSRYLAWIEGRFAALGGFREQRALGSLEEALEEAEVVVCCAGLGARELVPDPSVFPIRGQVLRVARGDLERVFVDERRPEGLAYVVPRRDDAVLGGIAEEGRSELAPDPAASEGILARCARLEPRVLELERLEVKVGLRPGREVVRLEAEVPAPGKLLVHDYGHGGAGVTLSWGCAEEVVSLVRAGTGQGR